jgi:hypothetical protein
MRLGYLVADPKTQFEERAMLGPRVRSLAFLLAVIWSSGPSLAQTAPPAPAAGKGESVATVKLPKALMITRTKLDPWEIAAISIALPEFTGDSFRVSRFDLNGDRKLELVVQPLSTCTTGTRKCALFIIGRNSATWRNVMPGGDALSVDRLTIEPGRGDAGFRSFWVGTHVAFWYGGSFEDGYYSAPSLRELTSVVG